MLDPAFRSRLPEYVFANLGGSVDDSQVWQCFSGNFPTAVLASGVDPMPSDVTLPVMTPAAATPTAVAGGSPGAFTPPAAIPSTLAELALMGALGATTAWTAGQYVVLADASQAHWDGTQWMPAPAP